MHKFKYNWKLKRPFVSKETDFSDYSYTDCYCCIDIYTNTYIIIDLIHNYCTLRYDQYTYQRECKHFSHNGKNTWVILSTSCNSELVPLKRKVIRVDDFHQYMVIQEDGHDRTRGLLAHRLVLFQIILFNLDTGWIISLVMKGLRKTSLSA